MGESYIPNLKGGEFYFFGAAAPLYDQKGNLVGAIECIRDITERRNTDQRLESELRKFKVLYDLAVNISADKSLNENLAFIVEQSRNLLHADTSYIALADEQCQEVYMHTVSGIRTEAFKKMRLPFGRGLGGKVMTTRKGYIIEDYHQDGTITHIVDQVVIDEGLVSGMAVPIQIGEKSLGVLYVFNHTKTQFKQEDMNTLSLLGNLAAVEIAIHEAQQALRKSERTSKRFAQENAAIAEIGRIISSTLNIEEVYDRFAEEVKELIPFDRIAIRTINPKDNTTTTAYILGVDVPGRQLGSTVPLFGTVIERCIRTQSSLLFQPESMDEVVNRFPHLLPTFKAGLRSMMFVPLISKDQVIGVLSLQTTKPKTHTEGDLRLAGRVGHQIAGAIVNAQLFADLKQTEEAKEKLICELENALSQIKQLKGLLPICMYCKKIRNDKNYWEAVESYITVHSEAIFSHGVCPECHKKYIEPQLKQLESEEK
jgi:GAF domain-containing protein